jgi:hypothetical protein
MQFVSVFNWFAITLDEKVGAVGTKRSRSSALCERSAILIV